MQPQEIANLLRSHIIRHARASVVDIEIRSLGDVGSVELPEGDVRIRIPQGTLPSGFRNVLVLFEASLEGKPVRTFWVVVNASVRSRCVRVTRRIPFGTAVSTDSVETAVVEIPDLRSEYFVDIGDVVGKVARRTLSPGDPLTRDVLTNPYLVRSGETVRLRLEKHGVLLAALAKAEQNGKIGQVIRVRNLDFARSLKARVVAPGEVRIE